MIVESLPNKHRACRTHCCVLHGCKYGHEDCPVTNAIIKQEYLCEYCGLFHIKMLEIDKTFLKENRKSKLLNL